MLAAIKRLEASGAEPRLTSLEADSLQINRNPLLGRFGVEIGKPKRIYRVEPVREPVPSKRRPDTAPQPARKRPSTAPAK
jgi:hypothetical protein